jgi:crossover junction endodeoxyribonuclease RuvC
MRVLGIDPGTRYLGYGVVEEQRGRLVHLGHGVVKADPSAALELRLSQIFTELTAAAKLFKPDAVSVEGLFTFKNARSALILGHARGVALLVAARFGLSVHEYSPAQVKRAVGAGGGQGKDAVARMVYTFLEMPRPEGMRHDASDALAVAMCHLNRARAPVPSGGRKKAVSFADRLKPSYIAGSR